MELNEHKYQCLFGNEPAQKRKRVLLFVDDIPNYQIFKLAAFPPLIGMTLGGTVGGVVGTLGGPKGVVFGAGSGAGVGFLAGGSYATYKSRRHYRDWLKQHRCDEVLADFYHVIKCEPASQDFLCAITGELMHQPMEDTCGHNYERKAIIAWIEKYGKHPISETPMSLEDLRPNYGLMGRQAKFYKQILTGSVSSETLSPIQREGIHSLLADLEVQIKSCFRAENRVLFELYNSGKISMQAYTSQLNIVATLLDDN